MDRAIYIQWPGKMWDVAGRYTPTRNYFTLKDAVQRLVSAPQPVPT